MDADAQADKNTKLVRLLGVGFIVGGIIWLGAFNKSEPTSNWPEVAANVTSFQKYTGRGNTPMKHAELSYSIQGRAYHSSAEIQDYPRFATGKNNTIYVDYDHVTVHYNPKDPSQTLSPGRETYPEQVEVAHKIPLVLIAGGVVLLLISLMNFRKPSVN